MSPGPVDLRVGRELWGVNGDGMSLWCLVSALLDCVGNMEVLLPKVLCLSTD